MRKALHRLVLCGATGFSFAGKLDDLYFCHCSQCRKNYGLYGGVARSALVMDKADKLRACKSSKTTTCTFCGACGSPIAGNIRTTGATHIHTKDKGGYYTICE